MLRTYRNAVRAAVVYEKLCGELLDPDGSSAAGEESISEEGEDPEEIPDIDNRGADERFQKLKERYPEEDWMRGMEKQWEQMRTGRTACGEKP